jgi:hypothetical protein
MAKRSESSGPQTPASTDPPPSPAVPPSPLPDPASQPAGPAQPATAPQPPPHATSIEPTPPATAVQSTASPPIPAVNTPVTAPGGSAPSPSPSVPGRVGSSGRLPPSWRSWILPKSKIVAAAWALVFTAVGGVITYLVQTYYIDIPRLHIDILSVNRSISGTAKVSLAGVYWFSENGNFAFEALAWFGGQGQSPLTL